MSEYVPCVRKNPSGRPPFCPFAPRFERPIGTKKGKKREGEEERYVNFVSKNEGAATAAHKQLYFKMNIAGCERKLPLCPLTDDLYIGAFVIFGDPELTTACAKELLKRAPAYDYMISAEAKGIPLVHEMARLAGNQKYMLARKAHKLYMPDALEVKVHSITTAKEQMLCIDKEDAALMKGKRILIVDDVISTGESLKALETLVEKAGGHICGRLTILAEGDAQQRENLLYLEKLPLFRREKDGTMSILGEASGEIVSE